LDRSKIWCFEGLLVYPLAIEMPSILLFGISENGCVDILGHVPARLFYCIFTWLVQRFDNLELARAVHFSGQSLSEYQLQPNDFYSS
jgi:hypothetical protein